MQDNRYTHSRPILKTRYLKKIVNNIQRKVSFVDEVTRDPISVVHEYPIDSRIEDTPKIKVPIAEEVSEGSCACLIF